MYIRRYDLVNIFSQIYCFVNLVSNFLMNFPKSGSIITNICTYMMYTNSVSCKNGWHKHLSYPAVISLIATLMHSTTADPLALDGLLVLDIRSGLIAGVIMTEEQAHLSAQSYVNVSRLSYVLLRSHSLLSCK